MSEPLTGRSDAIAVPMRRLGRPEDLADIVRFLATDLSGFVTVRTIPVDGG